MKTIFAITLLLCTLISKAQDASMPHGKSTIFIYSGKTIKNVRLWSIDSVKVEYVLKGNLSDVSTKDVSKIETTEYQITFDEERKVIKKQYDLIFLKSGDTLSCFIQQVDYWQIIYLPAGKEVAKSIAKSSYINYTQFQEPTINIQNDSLNVEEKDSNVVASLSDTSNSKLTEPIVNFNTTTTNINTKETDTLASVSNTPTNADVYSNSDETENFTKSAAKQKTIKVVTGLIMGLFYLLIYASR